MTIGKRLSQVVVYQREIYLPPTILIFEKLLSRSDRHRRLSTLFVTPFAILISACATRHPSNISAERTRPAPPVEQQMRASQSMQEQLSRNAAAGFIAGPSYADCDSALEQAKKTRSTIFDRSAPAEARKNARALCARVEEVACQRITQWVRNGHIPAQNSYPQVQGFDVAVAALIEDARFSPAFGVTYDRMNVEDRKRYMRSMGNCNDGAGRSIFYGRDSSAAQRVLGYDSGAVLTQLRKSAGEVDSAVAESSRLSENAEDYKRLVAIEANATAKKQMISPEAWERFQRAMNASEDRVFISVERGNTESIVLSARTVEDLRGLVQSTEQLASGRPPAFSDAVRQARAALIATRSAKIHQMVGGFAIEEERNYQQIMSRPADPISKLAEAKKEEERLSSAYRSGMSFSEFRSFNERREQYRARLIESATPALITRIQSAESVAAINILVSQSVLKADLESSVGAPLRSAIQQRSADVAPFSAFGGGDYLNAIYSGNFQQLRDLDDEYMRAMRGLVNRSFPPALANLLNSPSASMVNYVMTVYIVNYGTLYRSCMRPGSLRKTITTVTRNGYGMVVREEPRTYEVNAEFERPFRDFRDDSPYSQMLGDLIFNGGSMTKLAAGTEQLMSTYQCTDQRLKRFEANLLKFYNQIN